MPATATGRGAQVILTGQVRRAARGSAANSLVENSRIKADLERAGLISDGSIPDGRTYSGGPAHDVFVVAPEAELDAALSSITVPAGGSIQAAHTALPATGGSIVLSANTTYNITQTIVISKPNVRLSASSWSAVVKRNAAFTSGAIILVTGAGCMIDGFTIDANSVAGATDFELRTDGADCLVSRMQIINSAGVGHLGIRGDNNRATGNTITGLGVDLGTERGYGIWALNVKTVTIEHNTVTGTGIDGIGVCGNGSRVIGNRVSNCHCYVGGPGGQIAVYPLDGSQAGGNGSAVIGNTVGTGGGPSSFGIEVDGPNAVVAGNVIDTMKSYGIVLLGSGATVTGNLIRNSPTTFSGDAIVVLANATDFVISGNRMFDDRVTPIMRTGVWVSAGASDRYTIVGNTIVAPTMTGINDLGTGTVKTIANNTGYASRTAGPTTYSAAGTALTVSNNASIGGALLVGPATTDPAFRFDVNARLASARFQVTNAGSQTSVLITALPTTTTSPPTVTASILDLIGTGSSSIRQTMTTTGTNFISFRSAAGTMGTPAPTNSNQVMGALQATGYVPTLGWAPTGGAGISFTAGGIWSDSSQPTYIQFFTTAIGATSAPEVMRVSPNGNLLIGTGVDGTIKLDVAGSARFGTVGFNNTVPIAKPTGWGAPTGTATRATFITGSVTLPQLAEHLKALIDDLTAYGLIGP